MGLSNEEFTSAKKNPNFHTKFPLHKYRMKSGMLDHCHLGVTILPEQYSTGKKERKTI
jgi:hypothetical protein